MNRGWKNNILSSYNINFPWIVKNIKTLKEQVPHAQFQITPTISIWNVFDFPEFFNYMVEEGFIDDKTSSPRFNLATSPWYANIMILPKHIKRRLVELYEVSLKRYENVNIDIYNGFKMIIYNNFFITISNIILHFTMLKDYGY